ncbi:MULTISPECIES: hypothetical protein [Cyanophyceae]|uniref:hypothetical protein n=1 Tax=Cyanophyceae TaxID=3028117 RepID=UPI00232A812C|nr:MULTISPECIES: hypothetical protein [Cyanophyceae]MDB9316105.1 hypothetical protein [Nodularia spumigena CS-590/01A]MDB9320545.1 hypothetical protein [Nodularia spumigena CS-591/07A]MDB9324763.1 hypothetical protein [Nodularia spumigena CS-590/02]MDB9329248.1 hypothetical protein [Nodularia spumigena CS-591/04]MDB9333607.1 hypothetical protein [Nodularia spumigena CS-590/01]
MAIPFTQREMARAWRDHLSAYEKSQQIPRTNAHRLLLFYAVECGLKVILMKRKESKGHRTDLCTEIVECQHNINKLLDYLKAGVSLNLPDIFMEEISVTNNYKKNNPKNERKINSGQINQMWRYGAKVISIVDQEKQAQSNDEDIEKKLVAISQWIKGEIERL